MGCSTLIGQAPPTPQGGGRRPTGWLRAVGASSRGRPSQLIGQRSVIVEKVIREGGEAVKVVVSFTF